MSTDSVLIFPGLQRVHRAEGANVPGQVGPPQETVRSARGGHASRVHQKTEKSRAGRFSNRLVKMEIYIYQNFY